MKGSSLVWEPNAQESWLSILQNRFSMIATNSRLATSFDIPVSTLRRLPLYLSCAAKGVHMVDEGYELLVEIGIQDVAINFDVADHQIHHVHAQLQGYYERQIALSSLQRGACILVRHYLTPLLSGKGVILLEGEEQECFYLVRITFSLITICYSVF